MKQWDTAGPSARDGPLSAADVNPEAYLDPYVLLSATRDDQGQIEDFRYVEANRAACTELGRSLAELLSMSFLQMDPAAKSAGLIDMFVDVVETGEPLTLEDWEYPAHLRNGQALYYDMSAVRVGDGIGLAWWDVTVRYASAREVAKTELQLRSILESLIDPHAVIVPRRDEHGRVVTFEYSRVNAAACDNLGRSREELLGASLHDVLDPENERLVAGWAMSVWETGQPLALEEAVAPGPSYVDVRAVKVGDAVSFTWRNVTARVNTAIEMTQSREHYRLLAENASEMVFRTGPDHLIEWVSPSVTRVLGWPREHFAGRSLADFLHPEDAISARNAKQESLARGITSASMEMRMACADGSWRWMSNLGKAITDENGQIIGGVDAMRDIHEQKLAEAALKDSEERFRRSMMDAAIGMALVSRDGAYLKVNPAMSVLLGRDEQTLMSSTWQDLTHPDDLDIDLQHFYEILDGTRDTYRLAKRYVKPDGDVVWADLTVSGVRDEHGSLRHFVSQIIDITDSVQAREALASSEAHYRLIAQNSSDVVFRSTLDGRLEWVSPSVRDVLGFAPEQLIGEVMLRYLKIGDLPESVTLNPDSRESVDFEGRCLVADGSYLWMDISSRPLVGESGEVIGRMGRLRDIQAEHEARDALQHSEQRFRTAMESAPTGMAVIDLNRVFLEVNPALCQLLGRSEQWLLTHSLADVLDPPDDDLDRRVRAQLLAGLQTTLSRDHQMIRSDGQRLLVEQSIGLLRDESGKATGYVSQFADVTEARAARERLRFLATHDSMTELLNRHELMTRVSGVLSQRPRTGVNIGVLFFDLDGLKPVNDTYGHAVGDAVITTVADRIRRRIRSSDLLARFGGDEFVLVLPAVHAVHDVERIAASLHEAVNEPMDIEGNTISMTLSIGVSVVESGESADVALRRADSALYRAKRQGKACTAVYDPELDG
jgi:diguanylate cyclase (GGDEF)-like protein/PAS domain S-box-containing protein